MVYWNSGPTIECHMKLSAVLPLPALTNINSQKIFHLTHTYTQIPPWCIVFIYKKNFLFNALLNSHIFRQIFWRTTLNCPHQ